MSHDSERPADSGPTDDEPGEHERRHLFERAIPEVIKRLIERALETGVEKIAEAPENLRDLVSDLKLPKEAAQYFYEQIDDTKKGLYRVVAKEIRDVLEHVNMSDEIADVLTKLQFEINTTIRFVPQGAAPEDEQGEEAEKHSLPRPKVVSKVVMKARDVLKSRERGEPKE
jgi:hypothetical protein